MEERDFGRGSQPYESPNTFWCPGWRIQFSKILVSECLIMRSSFDGRNWLHRKNEYIDFLEVWGVMSIAYKKDADCNVCR